jgi:hypothetical protein
MRKALCRLALCVAKQATAIVAHEAGHYVAAKAYGLNPRIGFSGTGARTIYESGATSQQNTVITLAGPVAQAACSVLLSRRGSYLVAAAMAIASLARNFAPISSSDGQRLCGPESGSESLRGNLYWMSTITASAIGCLKGDCWTLLEQVSVYDLYVGKARRWLQRETFHTQVRMKKFEL